MRTAVTSVGAALDDIRADLHVGGAGAGLITTLPVLCFAALGALTPRLAARFGARRMLVAGLLTMTVGMVLRTFAGSLWSFALLSVLALAGGATSNVLMPGLVKQHFPDRIGTMTAVYTTALAVGTTAAAGLTVPVGRLAESGTGEWRLGVSGWAAIGLLAVPPWLLTLRSADPHATQAPARVPLSALARSRTAWAMVIFFGTQSLQAYVGFGWYATFLSDHGLSDSAAGGWVAFFSALGIPVSMLMPALVARGIAKVIVVLSACFLVAYVGLLVAPAGGVWLWMLLAGLGSGLFPLVLTMIGLRTVAPETTAALSAFTQGIGYLIAGAGPLLTGVLLGATGGWAAPFAVLFVALALTVTSGLVAARGRTVDEELGLLPAGAR